ncbi:related to GPI transamidase component GPI16 [Saccharomycodes ludwigii]|uniref:Related to GPI transamidase component GPI16 n=1 Tax=Saccharomycodes ludwigii TaxID=36035 RepID=A0A376B4P3_9ASCO|nr:related to GPI transamidase component GPI16 [Saccharomycodes ludwigii]
MVFPATKLITLVALCVIVFIDICLASPSSLVGIESQNEIKYPFEEKLTLEPLPNNFLFASFQFLLASNDFLINKKNIDPSKFTHYTVFPKSISPILEQTDTKKLSLRFTHGLWDSKSWGKLPHNGYNSGGSGVEIWGLIEARNNTDAMSKWNQLTNQLSGLFCASIDFIDSSKTTFPSNSDVFLNNLESIPMTDPLENSLFLMRGSLANEPICTENLTPFIKLLPNREKSGIASLLDGHKVFDSFWNSMSLEVDTICSDDGICHYVLEILVETVLNVPQLLSRNKNPIPKPSTSDELRCDRSKNTDEVQCFPLPEKSNYDYHLSDLFGKKVNGNNLLSETYSKVCMVSASAENWKIFIKIGDDYFSTSDNCYNLNVDSPIDFFIETEDSSDVSVREHAPVHVSRSLTGYSQDRGGLRISFWNPSVDKNIDVVYFESLPWFMQPYLSSLSLESDANTINDELGEIIKDTYFLPAIDRKRPSHIEFQLNVPANTTITMSYQFDKPLLKYAEYPPDANHGFEIESAFIAVKGWSSDSHKKGREEIYFLRTPTLLLSLSTPDFSMPYNVIILTSTVMAMIFGMIFNMMTKRFITVQKADEIASKSKIRQLVGKLKNLKRVAS